MGSEPWGGLRGGCGCWGFGWVDERLGFGARLCRGGVGVRGWGLGGGGWGVPREARRHEASEDQGDEDAHDAVGDPELLLELVSEGFDLLLKAVELPLG